MHSRFAYVCIIVPPKLNKSLIKSVLLCVFCVCVFILVFATWISQKVKIVFLFLLSLFFFYYSIFQNLLPYQQMTAVF